MLLGSPSRLSFFSDRHNVPYFGKTTMGYLNTFNFEITNLYYSVMQKKKMRFLNETGSEKKIVYIL